MRVLRQLRVPYAFTGGIVVGFYGFPRATYDVDVVIEARDPSKLVRMLRKVGFELNPDEAKLMMEKGNRFVCYLGPCRVDLWLAKTPREMAELRRARTVRIFGMRTRLLAPEDVILRKLDSGRGKDFEDALGILVRQKGKLDLSYLKSRASALRLERAIAKLFREAERAEAAA